MAGPTLPPSLSRKRPPPSGDEEAGTILKLGEFENVPCLSVAETNALLENIKSSRENHEPMSTDVYVKTRDYVKTFARFQDQQAVMSVDKRLEDLITQGKIVPFEKAQLATLCCDSADEATTLIPSLEGKLSNDELQEVLDDIAKYRDFV
ncbi:hypothetical protein EJ03DRAFT_323743 [Teratosphaeria nubilosa]|uniref:RNA polymerase Rpb4/RPC9 core domain-containing protein n=2 Tax=Teratosphaeria TaxID=237584 RepID=A0A6G1LK51_9PEZI|nr:hypothetical protein EJ03DRAFT_323743 [Teratosphaeria nubilosa]KAH9817769.1 DNA-directed RNA polymerase II subunit rpb4 [Teratosphaeria destructans]